MAAQTPRLRRALISAAFVVAACTPSAAPPTSVPPTETPGEAGNLPPGCDPIDLRTTSGQTVDLTGIWIQDEKEGRQPSKWWIRAFGDCVWGSGTYDDYTEDAVLRRADSVQVLQGRIGNDIVIDGTIVLLGSPPFFEVPQFFAEVRIIIDFDDDGQIMLREDRAPGVQGPRCHEPGGYCPAPLLLRPAT